MRLKYIPSGFILWMFSLSFTGCDAAGEIKPVIPEAQDLEKMAMVEESLTALSVQFSADRKVEWAAAFSLLRGHLEANPDIFGAAFAFVPEKQAGTVVKASPYVYRSGDNLEKKDLIDSYDYTEESWYTEPVKLKEPLWSEPYFDEGGGDIWMKTYSIPIYDEENRLIGVLTSDLPVNAQVDTGIGGASASDGLLAD